MFKELFSGGCDDPVLRKLSICNWDRLLLRERPWPTVVSESCTCADALQMAQRWFDSTIAQDHRLTDSDVARWRNQKLEWQVEKVTMAGSGGSIHNFDLPCFKNNVGERLAIASLSWAYGPLDRGHMHTYEFCVLRLERNCFKCMSWSHGH